MYAGEGLTTAFFKSLRGYLLTKAVTVHCPCEWRGWHTVCRWGADHSILQVTERLFANKGSRTNRRHLSAGHLNISWDVVWASSGSGRSHTEPVDLNTRRLEDDVVVEGTSYIAAFLSKVSIPHQILGKGLLLDDFCRGPPKDHLAAVECLGYAVR